MQVRVDIGYRKIKKNRIIENKGRKKEGYYYLLL
jgi:hypothetical protein